MKKMMFVIFLVLLPVVAASPPPHRAVSYYEVSYLREVAPLTVDNLLLSMGVLGIKSPEVVLAQIMLETGNLTSQLCLEQNNLLGMRLARVRQTTAIGEANYHAVYRCWYESLEDYALWQQYHEAKGKDMSDYYAFLADVGYATDSHYIRKLKGK